MFLLQRQILLLKLLFCLVCGQDLLCPYEECVCSSSSVICRDAKLTRMPTLRTGANVQPVTILSLSGQEIKEIPSGSLPSGLVTVLLENMPLGRIDPAAFKDSGATLDRLSFSDSAFTEIPDALLMLENITYLSLQNITIKKWNTTVLSHLGLTLKDLVLHQVDLKPWPEGLKYFPVMEYLDLQDSSVSNIPDDVFVNMKDNLTFLRLENAGLSQIPKSLSEVRKLSLNLKANIIRHLENMPQVSTLDLTHNLLSDADNVVQALQTSANSLWSLYLSYNKLTSFPDLSNFTLLMYLTLDNNDIVADSASILQNSTRPNVLQTLSMSYNKLTFFPNIASSPQLTKLLLDNNNIASIPASNSQQSATKLNTLILSFNQLTSISNLPRCYNLITLSLDNNRLSDFSLDPFLPSASSLEILALSYNELNTIPNLSNFSALKELYIDHNNIATLSFLPANIQYLKLQNNRLASVPTTIADITELKKLNLSTNSISEFISTNIPSQLMELDLSANLITNLGNNNFPEYCSVGYLYLQSNPINFIAGNAFDNTKKLLVIDLSKTDIVSFPLAVTSLNQLINLHMNDLPNLKCVCPVPKELNDWMARAPDLRFIYGRCRNGDKTLASYLLPGNKCEPNQGITLVHVIGDRRSILLYFIFHIIVLRLI